MTLPYSSSVRISVFTAVCALATATLSAQPHASRFRFHELDVNRDGVISRDEWRGSRREFRRYDRNGDGVLSRDEFVAARQPDRGEPTQEDSRYRDEQARPSDSTQAGRPTSRAFEAGQQRGVEDGRQAAREDSSRGRWDLDGQRELTRADSGYRNDLGSLDEYQAGYREGFMSAYRSTFGPRAPRHGEAYRAGETRGLADGREAGRQDATRQHWDLEGQRELVLADAGYRPELGSRSDYQEGYRAGFHQGYGDGFGRR